MSVLFPYVPKGHLAAMLAGGIAAASCERSPRDLTAYNRHRDKLAAMLDPRCYPLSWMDEAVAAGPLFSMGSANAVILFEVKSYPGGAKELHGMAAAGDLNGILALIARAEHWAAANGCTFCRIASRSAWARVLRPLGYEFHQVDLRKELAWAC